MTDELTGDGILTDHPNVTLLDYVDLHGEPVHVGSDRVVFSDQHGHELNEWADALEADRDELSERMHELAREVSDYNWSTSDPVVFDAGTFRRDNFELVALLLRQGCSPAAALDWFATEQNNWTQTDWAKWRGVSQQNVSGNVSKAKAELDD